MQRPSKGHTNGHVTNHCPFPVYIHQAAAKYSSVTGKSCENCGDMTDLLGQLGEVYVFPTTTSDQRV